MVATASGAPCCAGLAGGGGGRGAAGAFLLGAGAVCDSVATLQRLRICAAVRHACSAAAYRLGRPETRWLGVLSPATAIRITQSLRIFRKRFLDHIEPPFVVVLKVAREIGILEPVR